MNSNGNSRTPFDNDLVNDPNAPRTTQPLPAQPGISNPPPMGHPVGQPVGQPVPPTGRHLPPQVVTGNMDDEDDAYRPTRKLPTSTLVGFGMAGGALAMVLLAAIVSRVLPKPDPKQLKPVDAINPVVIRTEPSNSLPDTAVGDDELPPPGREARRPGTGATNDSPRTPAEGAATDDLPGAGNDNNSGDTSTGDSSSDSDGGNRSGDSRSDSDTSDRNSSASTGSGGRYVSRRNGYSINLPAGFTRQNSGRRSTWRGPDGARLIVERSSAPGSSPRSDWEKLDRALSRKYGSKYRSHGIRETTLAGRPAAVWEFEIDGPRGTTRKIDVAVHHNNRGYAVLGEAPAEKFDEMRPRIEAAINSFQLDETEEDDAPARATTAPSRTESTPAPSVRRDIDEEQPRRRRRARTRRSRTREEAKVIREDDKETRREEKREKREDRSERREREREDDDGPTQGY